MPIKGLTDNKDPKLPRIGFLRKGGPKRKRKNRKGEEYEIFGEDLDHWRFVSEDEEAMADFYEHYGPEPRAVNIYMPWPEKDQVWQTWKEQYTAGALQHRCDGETCVLWLNKKSGQYSQEPIPCPGGCHEVGYLTVIVPELQRLALVTVVTHSIHDIVEIESNLLAYQALATQLRGVPFVLRRVKRMISTPDEKTGKRVRREKWLMHIETAPAWTKAKLAGDQFDAIPAHVRAGLPAVAETQYIIDSYRIDERVQEVDAMDAEERAEMLKANVTAMRGDEDFEGFSDEDPDYKHGQEAEGDAPLEQPFKDQGTAIQWAKGLGLYNGDTKEIVTLFGEVLDETGAKQNENAKWSDAWRDWVSIALAQQQAN